jgi:hypothetical protein
MPTPVQIYNIYCDESCHLEHDHQPIMGLGAVMCPLGHLAGANSAIQALKIKHKARGELKWEKVSASRLPFYEELIDYFFQEPALRFRGWLVERKDRLNHDFFNSGDHDSFYYKMFYYLLEPLVQWPQPGEEARTYRIYLDIKDSRSRLKVRYLGQVLRRRKRDTSKILVSRVQSADSRYLHLMQLTDFLLGALTYHNRPAPPKPNPAKLACVRRIQGLSHFTLLRGTPPWEQKFNFFTFTPQEVLQ